MFISKRCLFWHSRRIDSLRWLGAILAITIAFNSASAQQQFDPSRGILLHGTVVTMDAAETIIHNGSLLVRSGKIVAMWQGTHIPAGVQIGDAVSIDLGTRALIFPGLINLHNHPTFDPVEVWPPPSSHVQPALGRPLGTEPYAD